MSHPSSRSRDTATLPVRRTPPDSACPGPLALRLPSSGELYQLEGRDRFIVGSAEGCDLRVDDCYASARHCVIQRERGVLVLRDRGSKNGTLLDGTRIEAAELRPGQRIILGSTELFVLGPRAIERSARGSLLGEAPAFRRAVDTAVKAARHACSVLILGETGTGKELFARLIHEESRRSQDPFVPLNCGAISESIVASELFGHCKGAFTGADADRDGVFITAGEGTLFLDEIGELPAQHQPALLRALESKMIRPVGSALEVMTRARVVAATNRMHLDQSGSGFRSDLYHRLATIEIDLPPLRERREDIPLLAQAFLDDLAPEHGSRQLGASAIDAMLHHDWPGNIRELRHALVRAVALCPGELDAEVILPPQRRDRRPFRAADPSRSGGPSVESIASYDDALRSMLVEAYRRHGSVRKAARALGMAKSTFADRARKLGIQTRSIRARQSG